MNDEWAIQIEIDTLGAFVGAMSELMALDNDLRPTLWFRGHADASWKLLPGVLRNPFVNRVKQLVLNPTDPGEVKLGIDISERMINNEFRTEGASLLPPRAEPVDIYFTAQHYGLPTRLLDWTQNPLAALFFAANEIPTVNGEVLVAHPSQTMAGAEATVLRSLGLEYFPISERHPTIVATIQYLFDDGEAPPSAFIIPLRPDARTGRMMQQGSCFNASHAWNWGDSKRRHSALRRSGFAKSNAPRRASRHRRPLGHPVSRSRPLVQRN
jgi:hypothetical protein